MDIYSAIHDRRSVRKFKSDAISQETLESILEAARVAPSWANKQCWRYILVESDNVKDEIYSALPEKNPGTKTIKQAPYTVVLCADPEASGKAGSREYYMLDAGISMQQLMLAAHAEGLGTCWIAWIDDEQKIREALNLPEEIQLIALSPLGYPDKNAKPTPRKELSEIVYKDQWGKEMY